MNRFSGPKKFGFFLGKGRVGWGMRFAIQKGWKGREMLAVVSAAEGLGHSWSFRDTPLQGEIPMGSVEWCQEAFGPHRIDFYPAFLRGRLFREVVLVKSSEVFRPRPTVPVFVKDATAWKTDFASALQPKGFLLPSGEWWVSEPIRFVNEWRYYVADGYVITTGWYAGADENKPAPSLDVVWPVGFSGAVDMGELEDGFMALVECHAPFACGWYGEDHRDYVHWQAMAWKERGWWACGTGE